MSGVAATSFMSSSGRPLYISIGDKVEPCARLCGTIKAARRYLTAVRSTLKSQVEMYESDQVMRQVEAKYSTGIEFHKDYIDIWDRRIDFILISEPFFKLDMMTSMEYMLWFRLVGKHYLLPVEARSRQIRLKGPQRSPNIVGSEQVP
ncbi:hypothetical protein GOBAR_AA22593 [Gossypium barbadense]|uniref:Uncharacterized protein n=1 Tax=Gossypium barbadense TaxID=3634 RepID=A0A2P5X430_GOSBA|nr:hypothetical protein GOBAR_AA22593 [Gossypium barbadense]